MKKNIKTAGIVVLYQPSQITVDNVSSYMESFDELYLIDNSAYNNMPMFRDILSRGHVHYDALLHNYGIAYALNLGFEKSKGGGCVCAVSMDQDSRFETDIITVYKEYLRNNDAKNVAALTPQYDTGRNTVRNKTGIKETKRSMQSGTLFLLDAWDKIGPFNEKLFLDVVDWEYFLRIRRKNMSILRCNEAVLKHQPATTVFSVSLGG